MERLLEAERTRIGTGAVELAGVNAKRSGVFMEVLGNRQIFLEVGVV